MELQLPLPASITSSNVRRPGRCAFTSTAMLPGRCSFLHILEWGRRTVPCGFGVYFWGHLGRGKRLKNEPLLGTMAVLVNAQRPGLRTFEDVIEGSHA